MLIKISSPHWPIINGIATHTGNCMKKIKRRFADRVISIEIRLLDINGPKGGQDKVCSLLAKILNHPSINVEGRYEDLYTAITVATCRMEKVLEALKPFIGCIVPKMARSCRKSTCAERMWIFVPPVKGCGWMLVNWMI